MITLFLVQWNQAITINWKDFSQLWYSYAPYCFSTLEYLLYSLASRRPVQVFNRGFTANWKIMIWSLVDASMILCFLTFFCILDFTYSLFSMKIKQGRFRSFFPKNSIKMRWSNTVFMFSKINCSVIEVKISNIWHKKCLVPVNIKNFIIRFFLRFI